MSLVGYVKCFFRRYHVWTRWMNDDEKICKISRNCTTCHSVEQSQSHDFTDWEYELKYSCIQLRRCKRQGCGAFEMRTEHESFAPIAHEDTPCEIIEKCPRCSHQHIRDTIHDFKDGQCVRCGLVEPMILCEVEDWDQMNNLSSPEYPY